MDLTEGRVRPDHKGGYLVASGSQMKTVRAGDARGAGLGDGPIEWSPVELTPEIIKSHP